MSNRKPRSINEVQAHRGASAVAPENTIAGFRAARDQGARWVELDVVLLRDGTPVVIHDSTLDRTTNRQGSLADITAADLEGIDAGSKFGPQFAGERLATLPQVLDALAEFNLNVNVEIKARNFYSSHEQVTDTVHNCLVDHASRTQVMISSFDTHFLQAMHKLDPNYELAMLWSELPANWLEHLEQIPSRAVHLDYRSLNYRALDQARERGIAMRVWTCNDPALIEPFWTAGLDAVITDNPSLFLATAT